MSYTSPTIVASGGTFAQLQAEGVSGHLERLINKQVIPAPATPTVAVTGGGASGGLLAAGTYFFKTTWTTIWGESVPSPESAQATVAAGNIPRLTFGAIPTGVTLVSVYATPANGATGTEVLYGTATSGTTVDLSTAAPGGQPAPPTVNNSGLPIAVTSIARALLNAHQQAQADLYGISSRIANFLRGEGLTYSTFALAVLHRAAVFKLIWTALEEIAVLVDANQGTLGYGTTPGGVVFRKRTQP